MKKNLFLSIIFFFVSIFAAMSINAAGIDDVVVNEHYDKVMMASFDENSVEQSLISEARLHDGETMQNNQNGCTEAAVMISSKISPVMAEAKAEGIVYNPTLISFLQNKGVSVVNASETTLEPGDLLFFGKDAADEHVMVYLGHGMMTGNYSYLYGKDGMGGIWTTNVAEYAANEKPLRLVAKTSVTCFSAEANGISVHYVLHDTEDASVKDNSVKTIVIVVIAIVMMVSVVAVVVRKMTTEEVVENDTEAEPVVSVAVESEEEETVEVSEEVFASEVVEQEVKTEETINVIKDIINDVVNYVINKKESVKVVIPGAIVRVWHDPPGIVLDTT